MFPFYKYVHQPILSPCPIHPCRPPIVHQTSQHARCLGDSPHCFSGICLEWILSGNFCTHTTCETIICKQGCWTGGQVRRMEVSQRMLCWCQLICPSLSSPGFPV